jgi:hypothetical protein
MRATTVRFSQDLWGLLETEAGRQGISAAQFVRDATIMRLGFLSGQRGDAEAEATLGGLAERALARRGSSAAEARNSLAPIRDPDRLRAVRAAHILGTPPEDSFDRLAGLAARVLNAPVALISIVDEERQFFKSCLGLAEPWATSRQSPLSHSFCQHAVAAREPLIVADARKHPVLLDNAAIRDMGVIAYAGAPLLAFDGHALGTLCVIDHEPRVWTSDQVEILRDLASAVVTEIELRTARA